MSSADWNSILQLPKAALAGNTQVPKATVIRQAQLNKNDARVLNKVRRLEHFATVQKSTTRIPPTIDEDRNIQCIIVLRCEMSKSGAYAEVASVLHRCFPNPTLILFDGCQETCISVASTRRSRVQNGEVVVDHIESTGRMLKDEDVFARFYDSLAFDVMPQENLAVYLEAIARNIKLSRVTGPLGFYPTCSRQAQARLEPLIDRYDKLSSKISALSRQRKGNREIPLSDSARMRVQEAELGNVLRGVVEEIKEICNV